MPLDDFMEVDHESNQSIANHCQSVIAFQNEGAHSFFEEGVEELIEGSWGLYDEIAAHDFFIEVVVE